MNIHDLPEQAVDINAIRTRALKAISEVSPQTLLMAAKSQTRLHAANYITADEDAKAMLTTACMVADMKEPVLILGETGTGKELIAKIIHAPRQQSMHTYETPMQSINCAGLPESLFESLVFGSKRGSYTGSVCDEPGLLRNAGNGTAFLDEIGELPINAQAKLLRVLETQFVRPLGDTQEYKVNCRLVFATNRDLKAMVTAGTFRRDLYYRICTFTLRTKPLRDRPNDAMLIAKHYHKERGWGEIKGAIPLEAYNEGNVRGLLCYLTRKELLGLDDNEALAGL